MKRAALFPTFDEAVAQRGSCTATVAVVAATTDSIRYRLRLLPSSGPGTWALGALVPVVWAVVAGLWTPRGPLTTAEVLAAMIIGALVGYAAGLLSRSRWAMLVAPVVFMTVFEIMRLGYSGPTVDAPASSEYGIFAFVVGRGFHGLVGLTPMVLGAAFGAGTARWATPGDTVTGPAHPVTTDATDTESAEATNPPRSLSAAAKARRVVAIASAVALVALAALLARPASTEAIRTAEGDPAPDSVAELTAVEAGGKDLGMMIRGDDTDNPVILFLAGGPGGSERGAMRNHLEALEESFVVATWDQRGTGTSYPALDPTSTVTLAGYVDDTIQVTNHLRERFDEDRIYLLGQSWGSTLGVLAVQQAPELYRAFIGTGQMVSQRETDRIFYRDTLEWAADSDNTALVEELERIGPPPYDLMLDYETALANEHDVYPYDHSPNSEGEAGFSENFIVPEYSLTDQVHLLGSFMDTFAALYPQLQGIDFRETATSFEVPMFFVQGAHEAGGRAELFDDWYPMIEAPTKDLVVLETSGHRPLFEQPEAFVEYMENTVLAQSAPR